MFSQGLPFAPPPPNWQHPLPTQQVHGLVQYPQQAPPYVSPTVIDKNGIIKETLVNNKKGKKGTKTCHGQY